MPKISYRYLPQQTIVVWQPTKPGIGETPRQVLETAASHKNALRRTNPVTSLEYVGDLAALQKANALTPDGQKEIPLGSVYFIQNHQPPDPALLAVMKNSPDAHIAVLQKKHPFNLDKHLNTFA
ncbi:MAG: hypothetical protein VKJ06_08255 [Vampirovibrionales bacterium]|nr:hypothetical protein [Vampirovibrionales bacterium]